MSSLYPILMMVIQGMLAMAMLCRVVRCNRPGWLAFAAAFGLMSGQHAMGLLTDLRLDAETRPLFYLAVNLLFAIGYWSTSEESDCRICPLAGERKQLEQHGGLNR